MKKTAVLKISTLVLLGLSSLVAQEVPQTNEVIIKIPQVPEVPKVEAIVPKVVVVNSNGTPISTQNVSYTQREKPKVVFSNRIAPEKYAVILSKDKDEDSATLAGDIKNGRVAAYLRTPLITVKDAEENLKKAGFDILATYVVDKKDSVTSIVFSNEDMKKAASKNMRGFAGTLRLVVDNKNKLVNISNPIYTMGAFMQKDFDEALANKTLAQLREAFTTLEESQEIVKFQVLERFHFMENMPYYHDMKIVSKAPNTDLLEKAKKSKQVVYEQHLADGSIVLGVKLSPRTSKFVKKTGYENSGLLPYPVLIENGEAKIMEPQYYIAVMYPMLKMSQFMKIATVPGAIGKDIDKIFR
jgi:hypothetical protein